MTAKQVELVGGPLCGTKVDWYPEHAQSMELSYYGGKCNYSIEQNERTAFFAGDS